MLPDGAPVTAAEIDACRRLLARAAAAVSAEGRRLELLELSRAVGGSCAVALAGATRELAAELRSVVDELDRAAAGLGRTTGP
jgi:hypothetical protein